MTSIPLDEDKPRGAAPACRTPAGGCAGALTRSSCKCFRSLHAPLLLPRGRIAAFARILQKSGKGAQRLRGLRAASLLSW